MTITLPITWTPPGTPQTGVVQVEFTEVKNHKLKYHTREIDEKTIVWPVGFPEDQKEQYLKPLYHKLNAARQKVVLDDVSIER